MLSGDELTVLANTMKLYPAQRLHIKIANIDTNRQQMAMQIVGAARAAGWTATLEHYMAWGDPEKEPPTGMQLHVKDASAAVQHLGSALIQLYGRENMHDGYRDEHFEAGLIELSIWPRKL